MAEDKAYRKSFDEAVKLHRKGVQGDKKAAAAAHAHFAELRTADPANALVEAYYGSTLALLGRDAVHPLERSENVQLGLEALDRAVEMNPHKKTIRLIRANVCLRIPEEFFQRSQTAVEDYNYVLEKHRIKPDLLTREQLLQILHDLGTAYLNAGKPSEADATWQRLAQLDPKYKP